MCKHCWDNDKSEPHHKDWIRGGVPPEDGFVETPHKKKSKAKKRSRERNRCPENDGKGHVYIWIKESEFYGDPMIKFRDRYLGWHFEYRVCCGCLHRPNRKSFRVVRH